MAVRACDDNPHAEAAQAFIRRMSEQIADHPDLLDACVPELERFRQLLAAIPLTPVRAEDLAVSTVVGPLEDRMRHFIGAYHLLPQDALILSEAERLGVTAVAMLDLDWLWGWRGVWRLLSDVSHHSEVQDVCRCDCTNRKYFPITLAGRARSHHHAWRGHAVVQPEAAPVSGPEQSA
ncbi:MAG: hypothetical protein ABIL11_02920 [Chloroflexota bacterium]